MKKLLGGLLVISLLSRPSLLRIDYIAYEIYKASDQIIRSIRDTQEADAEANLVGTDDIDTAFDEIDRNSKGISRLLKDLNNVVLRLHTTMQLKAAARVSMSEEQMFAFSNFSAYYTDGTSELQCRLSSLQEGTGIESIKSELMSEDTDYCQLYDRLMDISDSQTEAIDSINGIIKAAEDTLCIIA